MQVIALTGRAGSGKDTAAALLQLMTSPTTATEPLDIVEYIYSMQSSPFNAINGFRQFQAYHIFKFAWPVYQIVGILLNRDPYELMIDAKFKNTLQHWGLTGRQLLQKVGTECFRDTIDQDIWCDVIHKNLIQKIPGAIISDLRFVNEAEFLKKEHNAFIIKLVGRDNGTPKDHPSEAQIDSIKQDYLLHNDGDYKDLAVQLETICQRLKILNAKYTWK